MNSVHQLLHGTKSHIFIARVRSTMGVCPSICLSTGGGSVQLAGRGQSSQWGGWVSPASRGGVSPADRGGGSVQLMGGSVQPVWGGPVQLMGGSGSVQLAGRVQSSQQGGCQSAGCGGLGTHYTASSMPLTFTQEAFLVSCKFNIFFSIVLWNVPRNEY